MQGLEIYLPLVEKHGACFWSIAASPFFCGIPTKRDWKL